MNPSPHEVVALHGIRVRASFPPESVSDAEPSPETGIASGDIAPSPGSIAASADA
jgi:hypothetical protein